MMWVNPQTLKGLMMNDDSKIIVNDVVKPGHIFSTEIDKRCKSVILCMTVCITLVPAPVMKTARRSQFVCLSLAYKWA